MAALHPERARGGTGYDIQNSAEALKPGATEVERRHWYWYWYWYWYYLNSERGATALEGDRARLCRQPSWRFSEAEFARIPQETPELFAEAVLQVSQ